MRMGNFRYKIPRSPPLPLTSTEQKLSQLQAELVSTTRMWAADEVSTAMAHRLNEPLTALLLYLHELQEEIRPYAHAAAVPNVMRELVEMAIFETRRVCDITERLGHILEAPLAEAVFARGLEATDHRKWCVNRQIGGQLATSPPRFGQPLTLREREVLALIAGGASNKAGGYQLGISTRTFEGHRAHIMQKLGAKNAADLGRLAMRQLSDA
jgi:DNA-binding CsgD family transcriptional regulator